MHYITGNLTSRIERCWYACFLIVSREWPVMSTGASVPLHLCQSLRVKEENKLV